MEGSREPEVNGPIKEGFGLCCCKYIAHAGCLVPNFIKERIVGILAVGDGGIVANHVGAVPGAASSEINVFS